jgi:parallel beta-helix repeat protein
LRLFADFAVIMPNYLIFTDGAGNVFAKNGRTGQIEFSGTDAASVIQQALNALTSGRTWKEKVIVKGDFQLSSKLDIPSYTVLDLTQARLIRQPETTFNMIEVISKQYVDIIGGVIDGNDDSVTHKGVDELTQMNIMLRDSSYCSVRGVTVINSTQNGIYLLDDSHNNVITENFVARNRRAGILLFSKTVGKGPKYNVISNNIVTGNGVPAAGRPGIYLSTVETRFNTVVGNVCFANYGMGIRVAEAVENYFGGNVLEANGDAGLITSGPADRNCLVGNVIRGNAVQGVYINGGDGWIIEGNLVVANGREGIRTIGKYSQIRGNIVYLNNRTGISLMSGADYSSVADNVVLNNSQEVAGGYVGILLSSVTYCLVQGNIAIDSQATKTQDRGIVEIGTADNNRIENNNVFPNRRTPYISKTGANTVVKNNHGHITENSGVATFSGTGTQTTFTISHGLAGAPKSWRVEAGSADAKGDKYVTADATNLIVVFAIAPPAGTNNVVLVWQAEM